MSECVCVWRKESEKFLHILVNTEKVENKKEKKEEEEDAR